MNSIQIRAFINIGAGRRMDEPNREACNEESCGSFRKGLPRALRSWIFRDKPTQHQGRRRSSNR